jgi:Tol biopolymer transport system component
LLGLLAADAATAPPSAAAGGSLFGPIPGLYYGSTRPKVGLNGAVVVFASRIQNFGAPEVPPFINGIYYRDRVQGKTGSVLKPIGASQPNGQSTPLAVSPDPGTNYVLYWSDASNLVPNDTLGQSDVFLNNRVTGAAERVSVGTGGVQANGRSASGSMSGNTVDGNPRYVAFSSVATNLVAGDTNGKADVFVRDRVAGTTTRVSFATGGTQGNGDSVDPQISDDGRYVVFSSLADNLVPGDTNHVVDVFVRDVVAGTTERVSVGHEGEAIGSSSAPAISADARFIAFQSNADNLVPGDENNYNDVFVRDRVMGTTERVSISTTDLEGQDDSEDPTISRDGRFVAFESYAEELNGYTADEWPLDGNISNDAYVRDRLGRVTQRASEKSNGFEAFADSWEAEISPDGQYVAFYTDSEEFVGEGNDSNWDDDVYLKYMGTGWGASPVGSRYRAIAPRRVLDTASTPVPAGWPAGTKLTNAGTLDVQVTGGSTGVPANATAVMLNLASTGETAAGAELTAFPTGTAQPGTVALHPRVGASTSNQVAVQVGTGGKVRVATNTGATHVQADIVGYYAPDEVGAFTGLRTWNVLDNRFGPVPPGWPPGQRLVAGSPSAQLDMKMTGEATGVPEYASAVVLGVSTVDPTTGTPAVTVFPTGTANPGTANVYPQIGGVVTNLVTTGLGPDGKVSFAVAGGATNVVVSVMGYYSPFGSDLFFPTAQARVLDTRSTKPKLVIPGHTGPVLPGTMKSVELAGRGNIPTNAQGLALTLSSTQATNPLGLLVTWPSDGEFALASSLGFGSGYNTSNSLMTSVGPNAGLTLFNFSASSTHLLADSYGYFR